MTLPIEVTSLEDPDNKVKTEIEFTQSVPLRLKKLRDLAEKYVTDSQHGYVNVRYMEQQWDHGMNNDPRIPGTRGAETAESGDCSDCTVTKFTKAGIAEALKEHARLHTSIRPRIESVPAAVSTESCATS